MNLDLLLGLLVEITGTDEVRRNPQLDLFEAHVLDSMRTVDLILALDERFGIRVSPAEFDRELWATPARFINDVQSRQP